MNQDLTNTQKLLRQFHIKKVNRGNFYNDFEKDYYNGLNFHLDRIYWLEDKCSKLESSNQYFKYLAKQKGETPTVQTNSSKLNGLKDYKNKLKAQEN